MKHLRVTHALLRGNRKLFLSTYKGAWYVYSPTRGVFLRYIYSLSQLRSNWPDAKIVPSTSKKGYPTREWDGHCVYQWVASM